MAGSLDFKNVRALGTAGLIEEKTHLADIEFEEEVTSLYIQLLWAYPLTGKFNLTFKDKLGAAITSAEVSPSEYDFESEDMFLSYNLNSPFLTVEVSYTHEHVDEENKIIFSGVVKGNNFVSSETISSLQSKLADIKLLLEAALKLM